MFFVHPVGDGHHLIIVTWGVTVKDSRYTTLITGCPTSERHSAPSSRFAPVVSLTCPSGSGHYLTGNMWDGEHVGWLVIF